MAPPHKTEYVPVEDRIYLDEAVERTMQAKGCSRRQAKRWLLKAFRSGELQTYIDPNEPVKH